MDIKTDGKVDVMVLVAVGSELLKLGIQALRRGEREVTEADVQAARRRGENSRTSLYDAIDEHESADDES